MPTTKDALRSLYTRGRGALAGLANKLGGDPAGFDHDPGPEMHRVTSRDLTNLFGKVLPSQDAALLADLMGRGNEALTGGLQAITGGEFYGPAGYDETDIQQNLVGIEEARRGLEAGANLETPPGKKKVRQTYGPSLE